MRWGDGEWALANANYIQMPPALKLPVPVHEPWDMRTDRCAACGLPFWAIREGLVDAQTPCAGKVR